jgi:hypothetical protein
VSAALCGTKFFITAGHRTQLLNKFLAHIRLENFRASVTVFLPMARLKKSQHVADSARTRHRAAPLFTSKPSLETAERIPA